MDAQPAVEERLVLAPEERRSAVLDVIGSARRRLMLSLFRCNDFRVLDALAEARSRGVAVQVLLTGHAKGWKKRLKELAMFLESMGADVRRYAGPVPKYHAKYIVADDGPALVASLNFTRKCFRVTCDFLVVTWDAAVVRGLTELFEADCRAPESAFPEQITERLIIGPDRARPQLGRLLEQAQSSIRIVDHKLRDPEMVRLLKRRQAEGISVHVLDKRELGHLVAHGKMILIDGRTAVVGSLALSPPSLDSRREVALLMREPNMVGQLNDYFERLAHG